MKNKTQKVNIASRTSAEAASSPAPTLHLKSFKRSVAFVVNTVNGSDRVGRDVTSGHVALTSLPVEQVQSPVPVPRAQPV